MTDLDDLTEEDLYPRRGEPCPRKGTAILIFWLVPGSSTELGWLPATVWMAMPSRGLFIAEWPSGQGEGGVCRHTFDVDKFDWKLAGR